MAEKAGSPPNAAEPAAEPAAEQDAAKKSPHNRESAPEAKPATSDGPEPQSSDGEEDFGDTDIPAGSLALDEGAVRQLFGHLAGPEQGRRTRFKRVNVSGQTAVGDNNTILSINAVKEPEPYVGPVPHIAEIRLRYVSAASDRRLVDQLSQLHVVCLSGNSGTGRFTTACMALSEEFGSDGVHEIVLPGDAKLDSLMLSRDVPLKNKGHVLRLDPWHDLARLRSLEGIFRRRGARLIAIVNTSRGMERITVTHESADPLQIFEQHLRQAMAANGGANEVDGYCSMGSVRAAVEAAYRPHEIVDIVARIVERRPQSECEMDRLLSESTPRLRERAESALMLRPDPNGGPPSSRDQYLRAFRMAYGLFHGQPLHYVFDAVELLLDATNAAAGWPRNLRSSLEHPVSELLGKDLAQDWEDARRRVSATSAGMQRTARLRDPGLRPILLDLVWHEFDGTHHVLVEWLQGMVRQGDDVMRRTAADAAALLMSHNFELALRLLIDDWAKSPRWAVRQVAAWSVASAAIGSEVDQKVRDRVRKWIRESARCRDTAARVYASGLRQPYVQWTMRDLLQIAEDKGQLRNAVVAEALSELFDRDYAGPFVAEIALWLREGVSAQVGVHLARASLKLFERDDEQHPGSPDLLALVVDKSVAVEDVETLWRHILYESDTIAGAWRRLVVWTKSAGENQELQFPITELLQRLSTDPSTRRRLSFYLTQAWRGEGLPRWVLEGLEG